jgi:hypothetical protein
VRVAEIIGGLVGLWVAGVLFGRYVLPKTDPADLDDAYDEGRLDERNDWERGVDAYHGRPVATGRPEPWEPSPGDRLAQWAAGPRPEPETVISDSVAEIEAWGARGLAEIRARGEEARRQIAAWYEKEAPR